LPTFLRSQYLEGLNRKGKGANIMTAAKASHTKGQMVGEIEGEPI
jgi:hypothetical protein